MRIGRAAEATRGAATPTPVVEVGGVRGVSHVVRIEEPGACGRQELDVFEALVREGFDGSDEGLPLRIRRASRLAFWWAGPSPCGIGGLKSPDRGYRSRIFGRAGTEHLPGDFEVELGWVYVVPGHRGNGVATSLCSRLLASAHDRPVFATTRPGNDAMIAVLRRLGFSRAGNPFLRRGDPLLLYCRR